MFRLTTALQKRLKRASANGSLVRFPPVLTFQSVVDATVSTPALFTGLYNYLTNAGNELVFFDINRHAGVGSLLINDPLKRMQALMAPTGTKYRLSLVTNENPRSRRVAVTAYEDGKRLAPPLLLPWRWPEDVYSLSHIALSFPEDDPYYGNSVSAVNPGISLGNITPRGERGLIWIPANEVLRLRWNPFYPYLEQRVMAFLSLKKNTRQSELSP